MGEAGRRQRGRAPDQKIGLLAPPGDVDKILCTVVNNLLVTNNIDLQGDVRCRVLLTSPLESFTIGHTIVVSRGLLDVLPDEASLAMVLAHELSHIVLGHRLDTKLAFNDKMFFPDEDSFQRLDFRRNEADEAAADAKAIELLKNSPYKDKLGNAGLFLKALQEKAPDLPNLIRPHLGNSLFEGKSMRMSSLVGSAPALDEKRLDQIAALPLGGRIKVDPWTDQVELSKAKAVPLTSAHEKMEFEITPFFPYLTRLSTGGGGEGCAYDTFSHDAARAGTEISFHGVRETAGAQVSVECCRCRGQLRTAGEDEENRILTRGERARQPAFCWNACSRATGWRCRLARTRCWRSNR